MVVSNPSRRAGATGISTDTDREDEDKGEDVRAASTGRAASSGVKGKDAGGKEARKPRATSLSRRESGRRKSK